MRNPQAPPWLRGDQAGQLGLVDNIGSLNDLYQSIAEQQEWNDFNIKAIKRDLSPQEQLIRTLMEQAGTNMLSRFIGESSIFSALMNQHSLNTDAILFNDANNPANLDVVLALLYTGSRPSPLPYYDSSVAVSTLRFVH